MCRLWKFGFSLLIHSSNWLVVTMLTDRVLFRCATGSNRNICTTFVAKVTVIMIFIGLVALNVHSMWTYELNYIRMTDTLSCFQPYTDFFTTTWPWISGTLSTYVPLLWDAVAILVLLASLCCQSDARVGGINVVVDQQMVYVVLIVGIVHLSLCLPSTIVNILQFANRFSIYDESTYQYMADMYLLNALSHTLLCINFASTGFLYVISFSLFRRHLKALIMCKRDVTSAYEFGDGIEMECDTVRRGKNEQQSV